MQDYYAKALSGERLQLCYELAPPRVQQYLAAEIGFVTEQLDGLSSVLELGCGYGRVLQELRRKARYVLGIDTSQESLLLARRLLGRDAQCGLARMNAVSLAIRDKQFDAVVCVQNGIAAFGVDQGLLVGEAIRVTRSGGTVLFSSYSERFWAERLAWFRIQAQHGLIGEIDPVATGNGVIVSRDGFEAGTVGPEAFRSLAARHGVSARSMEIDDSSLFCEMSVP